MKLTSVEVADEVAWLAGGGMTAPYICAVLDRSPDAIYKALWRAGRNDLLAMFAAYSSQEKARRVAR